MFLVAATFLAFWPTLRNNLVDWDDPANLIDNAHVRGLSAANLKWMVTTFHEGHYQPLTWLTFILDYHLWGSVDARGIHLTSLVLHAANAVLFYFLALRVLDLCSLTAGASLQWGAGFASLLFALHPLRVESVAWATERRDVVSGLFFILALLAYLRSRWPGDRPSRGWFVASVFLHACACMAKVICVTLPAVLVILDFYPLRRLGGRRRWWGATFTAAWTEKIPFLLISLVASGTAVCAQGSALVPLDYISWSLRIPYTLLGLTYHLYKWLVPFHLIPMYEIQYQVGPLDWPFVLSAVVLVAVTIALLLVRRRFPAGLAVWLSYLVLLSPVTSITQNGWQFAADRYSYLSTMGLAVLVGGALSYVIRRHRDRRGPLAATGLLCVALAFLLGASTWRQTRLWHDSETLWSATIQVDPDSWVANRKLADVLMKAGRAQEEAEHYRRTLAVEQREASLHANAAVAFAKIGSLDEADRHAQTALEMEPGAESNLLNAAYVKRRRKEWDAAIGLYHKGARWHPADARFPRELGLTLALQGDHSQAVESFWQAIRLAPDDHRLYRAVAASLLELGRFQEAEDMARRALELEPDFEPARELLISIQARAAQTAANEQSEALRLRVEAAPEDMDARLKWADALAAAWRWEEAAEQYEQVLRRDSSDTAAREGLARALIASGRRTEAVRVIREGIGAGHADTRLILLLARQLAMSADPEVRDGPEAIRLAEELVHATPEPTAQMLAVLAAAYAEAGRFEDAVQTCQEAMERARQAGAEVLLERLRERIELYRAGRPYYQDGWRYTD
ncbi:MAG: tetratricopeptide repeat protein [Phycisphaerales bacterium]|nr:MAG: tetratricopeptide repeat protein [Phycisphaerales bacterium]